MKHKVVIWFGMLILLFAGFSSQALAYDVDVSANISPGPGYSTWGSGTTYSLPYWIFQTVDADGCQFGIGSEIRNSVYIDVDSTNDDIFIELVVDDPSDPDLATIVGQVGTYDYWSVGFVWNTPGKGTATCAAFW